MLILSRKLNECIVINGCVFVRVLRIDKETVKLGIQAPPEMSVHRQEVFDLIQKRKEASAGSGPPPALKE